MVKPLSLFQLFVRISNRLFNQTIVLLLAGAALSTIHAQDVIYGDRSVYFTSSSGTYPLNTFKADFGNVAGYSTDEQSRYQIISGMLGINLLKDELGQAGGTICDIQIANGTDYILRYKVKFEAGFDWRKGGKLPGLCGGMAYAGGADPSAGDGWSFRPVWHLYPGSNGDLPFLAPYAYYVDQPGVYGDEFASRFTITADTWYEIWIHIKMNTAGNNDGKLHLKVNNTSVYYNGAFRWVTEESGRAIDELMWDIFRGGSDADYISTRDCMVYFDDFVIDKQ